MVTHHVLVMEFVGKNNEIAPMLKDKKPKDPKKFFKKIIKNMKHLYETELVHADLSEFNILNLDETPVFIDFSQCSSLQDQRAEEYLLRDLKNVCNFFKKQGLKLDNEKVMEKIKEKTRAEDKK